jgi:hypothetical protein
MGNKKQKHKPDYEVIVGNIGTVYRGPDDTGARSHFEEYVKQSKTCQGRAGYEQVTLFEDGEILKEFNPCAKLIVNVHLTLEVRHSDPGETTWPGDDEAISLAKKRFNEYLAAGHTHVQSDDWVSTGVIVNVPEVAEHVTLASKEVVNG